MGGIVKKATDAVGLTDTEAAEGAYGSAQGSMAEVLRRLDKIDLPDIEKMKIALTLPEVVGELEAEELGPSAMEEIALDPVLREAQMKALADLTERGEVGLTEEDRILLDQAMRESAAEEKARQASILQGMAQRGNLDSGMQLAAQLSSSQSAAQGERQAAENQALASIQGRQNALSQAAQTAGQIQSQDFGRQSQMASAKDIINRFNTQNRMNVQAQNLANRQRISEKRGGLQNQQQMYNKGLQQQQFQNEMAKAGAAGGALTNMANMAQQRAAAQTQADAGVMSSIISGGSKMAAASDKNMKEQISEMNPDEMKRHLQEMLDNLDAYEYNYKDDPMEEKHVGIMAQDLEKSPLGSEFVEENVEGNKMVDYGKMAGTQLAATADLHDRVSNIEQLMGMISKKRG